MGKLLYIPEFGCRVVEGANKLAELQSNAYALTLAIKKLNAGNNNYSFKIAVKCLSNSDDPTFNKGVLDSVPFLGYSGRAVYVKEQAFFDWYATTPEGANYKRTCDAIGPHVYGHFLYR